MDNLNIQRINGYTVQLVADGVYAIDEFGVSICYLVIGGERAALIDTANGYGNLRDTVSALTKKPVTVLNTHGHADHIGGNAAFSDCRMDPADAFLVESSFTPEKWRKSCEKAQKEPGFYGKEYLRPDSVPQIPMPGPLSEGEVFSLGGRTLRMIKTPGHTPGSAVFLDEENRLLFAGDSVVSTPILIFDRYSSTVKEYLAGLKRLCGEAAKFDLIFPGHYLRPIAKTYLDDLVRCAEEIVAGGASFEPIDFSHMSAEPAVLHRAGRASIAYNEKHIG